MILKKPYAFLIKNFKIIHILLFVMVIFINNRYSNITSFFSSYVKNNAGENAEIVGTYINFYIYLATFLVITFAFIMLLLMRNKKKPTTFYILLFIYYLILLISIIFAYSTISSLLYNSITQQESRAYRDVYLILSLPQYYFIVLSLIRGIGFDVKKFNFSKDLAELEIKSEDNEEFEFVLGTESYKYKRKIRRALREIKYYILENKLIISIIVGGVILFLIGYSIVNFNFLNKVYKVGSTGNIGFFNYNLIEAYETENDYNGNIIKKDKKYIILKMKITNNSSLPQKFDNTSLYLKYGKKSAYNQPSLRNYFVDIGDAYINENIAENTSKDVIFIFELDKNIDYKYYYLNVLKEITYKNEQELYNYAKFKINPKPLTEISNSVEKKLNEIIFLEREFYGESSIVFSKVELLTSYEFKYELCLQENCKEYYDVIAPTNPSNQRLIVISYKFDKSKDLNISGSIKEDKDFFTKFLKLEYNYNGKNYIKDLSVQTYKNLENKLFIDIPKLIVDSKELKLVLNSRVSKYRIAISNI